MLDHDDVHSFRRIVNVPSRLLGEQTVKKVLEIKDKYRMDLFSAIDACKTLLTPKRYKALQDFKNLIIAFREKMETENLIDVYDELLDAIKYREFMNELDNSDERLENLEEFKSILVQIETDLRNLPRATKLQEAFDEAVLSEEKPERRRNNPKGITLSTIHSAKGLEFDYVFVIGLEENVFPNAYRFASDEELEEERRIAYVAFTRAKKKLHLLSTQSRLLYGEIFRNPTSRFVLEFSGVQPLEFDFNQEPDYVEEPEKPKENADFRVGDKVIHKAFGSGIIIAIEGESGQIFFDREKSLKKILLDHPALRKL
jgi:DNA helicase-2/ATP-dependent DNA helicase PcrA